LGDGQEKGGQEPMSALEAWIRKLWAMIKRWLDKQLGIEYTDKEAWRWLE